MSGTCKTSIDTWGTVVTSLVVLKLSGGLLFGFFSPPLLLSKECHSCHLLDLWGTSSHLVTFSMNSFVGDGECLWRNKKGISLRVLWWWWHPEFVFIYSMSAVGDMLPGRTGQTPDFGVAAETINAVPEKYWLHNVPKTHLLWIVLFRIEHMTNNTDPDLLFIASIVSLSVPATGIPLSVASSWGLYHQS